VIDDMKKDIEELKETVEELEERVESLETGDSTDSEEVEQKLYLYPYKTEKRERGIFTIERSEILLCRKEGDEYHVPNTEVGKYKSTTRQALEILYSLGLDEFERIEMLGKESENVYYKAEVGEEVTPDKDTAWVDEGKLENFVEYEESRLW
jgi:hypothetical protein